MFSYNFLFCGHIEVVDSDEKRVVHDPEALENSAISPKSRNERVVRLLLEQQTLGQDVHEVEILEGRRALFPLAFVCLKRNSQCYKYLLD